MDSKKSIEEWIAEKHYTNAIQQRINIFLNNNNDYSGIEEVQKVSEEDNLNTENDIEVLNSDVNIQNTSETEKEYICDEEVFNKLMEDVMRRCSQEVTPRQRAYIDYRILTLLDTIQNNV